MARPARPGVHEALLDASREELARRGIERARVEDVARRAGVSKGAFYLHFRTKHDAFRELASRFLGALDDHALRRREVEERLAAAEAGLPEADALALRLEAERALDQDLLELLWRNRHVFAAVDGASGEQPRELVAGARHRLRALVARRILDRRGPGRPRRDVDPEVVGDIVVGACVDLARRMIDMRTRPDLAAWARTLRLLIHGIREPPSAAGGPARRRARGRAARS